MWALCEENQSNTEGNKMFSLIKEEIHVIFLDRKTINTSDFLILIYMLKANSDSLWEFYLDFDNVCQGETYQEKNFFKRIMRMAFRYKILKLIKLQ